MKMEKLSSNFRYDINGLRALAVIAVMVFHFNPTWMPAGFVGVDIFFAISGYLMTSIIYRGIDSGSFSLIKFYAARCKRIIPALTLMVSIVVFIAYFIIEPYDYQKIGKHARDSLLFISNITYFSESGYFDVDSLEKFLLHTWSLSVEWQFYIIYPVIVLLASIFIGKTHLKHFILSLFLVSLILSCYITKTNASESYFMIHTRGWEMMAGGLAYLFPLKASVKIKRIVFYSSIFIVLSSIWIFSSKTPWPSFYAALPVIFTALVLSIRNDKEWLLGNYFSQKVGSLSYSLYLFHWPVLVFARKLNEVLSFPSFIIITFILSFISYHLIEKRRAKIIHILPFYIIVIAACQVVSIDGIGSRVDKKAQERASDYNLYYNPWMQYRNIQNNPIEINHANGSPQYILTGDSYALMYVKAMEQRGISFDVYANESCNVSMLSSKYVGSPSCQRMKFLLKKKLTSDTNTPLLISQSWDIYLGELGYDDAKKEVETFISELASINKNRRIYIIGTYHQPSYNPYTCILNNIGLKSNFISNMLSSGKCPVSESSSRDLTKSKVNLDALLSRVTEKYHNVKFISIKDEQCKNDSCTIIENGEPVIIRPHLTKYGANKYTQYIINAMKN
ncbi:acyltransferase family protein [Hafnia alvei]|uniref:acyltransferase family protein n=1 Tax=Hafnia alvei TaxID=569 RepID=UPI00345CF6C0